MGIRAYYAPENFYQNPFKLDGPVYEYAQNKMAGVHVRRKKESFATLSVSGTC